jgi:hypothetical protein
LTCASRLSQAALPGGPDRVSVESVALIPGTGGALAGGFTHAFGNQGSNVVAEILQYGP